MNGRNWRKLKQTNKQTMKLEEVKNKTKKENHPMV